MGKPNEAPLVHHIKRMDADRIVWALLEDVVEKSRLKERPQSDEKITGLFFEKKKKKKKQVTFNQMYM